METSASFAIRTARQFSVYSKVLSPQLGCIIAATACASLLSTLQIVFSPAANWSSQLAGYSPAMWIVLWGNQSECICPRLKRELSQQVRDRREGREDSRAPPSCYSHSYVTAPASNTNDILKLAHFGDNLGHPWKGGNFTALISTRALIKAVKETKWNN